MGHRQAFAIVNNFGSFHHLSLSAVIDLEQSFHLGF